MHNIRLSQYVRKYVCILCTLDYQYVWIGCMHTSYTLVVSIICEENMHTVRSSAAVVQVLSLMWLRTAMNHEATLKYIRYYLVHNPNLSYRTQVTHFFFYSIHSSYQLASTMPQDYYHTTLASMYTTTRITTTVGTTTMHIVQPTTRNQYPYLLLILVVLLEQQQLCIEQLEHASVKRLRLVLAISNTIVSVARMHTLVRSCKIMLLLLLYQLVCIVASLAPLCPLLEAATPQTGELPSNFRFLRSHIRIDWISGAISVTTAISTTRDPLPPPPVSYRGRGRIDPGAGRGAESSSV